LTNLGSGFFNITLDENDTGVLVDDTYSYYLRQGSELLKHGRVRLLIPEFDDDTQFDYTLDFTLS